LELLLSLSMFVDPFLRPFSYFIEFASRTTATAAGPRMRFSAYIANRAIGG